MTKHPIAPYAAIALGTIAGFAVVIPFGGLRLSQPVGSMVARCDAMGCTVPAAREHANGPSVGSQVPSQRC